MLISIGASEVAACIGFNPFKSERDMLEQIWSKYFPEKGVLTKEAQAEQWIRENRPDVLDSIEKKAGKDPVLLETFVQTELKHISDPNAARYVQSKANTLQGTRFEESTADTVSKREEVEWKKDSTFYRKTILTRNNVTFQLVGRIDRFEEENGEKILIEIKNRVHRLFKEVKEYENVQIQSYLELTGMEKAKLVEEYRKGNETYTIPVEKDSVKWNTVILPRLIAFCEKVC